MFKIPENLSEKSMNTKVQYIILFLIQVYTQIFLLVAGIAFLLVNLGVIYIDLPSVALYAGIVLVTTAGYVWFKFQKAKKEAKVFKKALEQQVVPGFDLTDIQLLNETDLSDLLHVLPYKIFRELFVISSRQYKIIKISHLWQQIHRPLSFTLNGSVFQ